MDPITLFGEPEPVEKPKKTRAKKEKIEKSIQIAEVLIPQEFDYIDWADRLKKLAKDPFTELVFKTRPQELWGSDPSIPQTKEHFEDMLHHLSKHNDITCDVETSGLSFVNPDVRICGHVFTAGEKSFYLPLRHNTEEWQLPVESTTKILTEEVYGRKDAVLNFHNVLFDYNQLLKDGIDLSWRFKEKNILDTQIMWWVLDENQKDDPYYYILRPGQPAEKTKYRSGFKGHAQQAAKLGAKKLEGYSLKVLAPKYIGTPMTKFDDLMELIGFQNLPIHFGGAYAKVDGSATHAIKKMGMPEIYKQKLEPALFNIEMKFARVNGNMQRRGMGINIPALDRMEKRAVEEQNKLKEELFAEIGEIKFSGKQLTALFHVQWGLPILAKTETGNPQFNADAFELYGEYLEKHGEQYGDKVRYPKMIVRIKKLEKIIGTYIKGIRKNIDVDGRVHTSLFQTQTVSGRLSSGDPNLQNLPAKPVFQDSLNKEKLIKMRNEIGDLMINKLFDFSVIFMDDEGEAIKHKDGWEEKCVRVVESWGFRDVFSEKGFTPEKREQYLSQYPRYGEIDAYVKPLSHGHGKVVSLDIWKKANTLEEYLLEVSDYSQMELRMMAHLANAKSMIDAYLTGVDIHIKTASDVFLVPIEKVKKDERNQAKGVNFGLVYGKTDYGFATDWYSQEPDFYVPSKWHPSGFEPAPKYLKQAKEFIDRYFNTYVEVRDYIDSRQKMVMMNGYVRTITGRKRRLPEVFSSSNSVKNRAMRQAVNSIDQGSSADYLKISMNALEDESEKLVEKDIFFFQLMTVHDEVIALTQKHVIPIVEPIMIEKMTKTVPLRCPVETDPVTVYTYGSAK